MQQMLGILIRGRHYRRALEVGLSMFPSKRIVPLFDDATLIHLASIGDLIQPFTVEIIKLAGEKENLNELTVLRNQLDVNKLS